MSLNIEIRTTVLSYLIMTFLLSCSNNKNRTDNTNTYTPLSTIDSWFKNQTSNQQIFQEGKVYKILQDDNEGSRHQKFIVKLSNSKTLLIAHNIDLSTRIPDLKNNDKVIFKGEYEWNKKGGVVHWTHKDPDHRHSDGYLIHNGIKYD